MSNFDINAYRSLTSCWTVSVDKSEGRVGVCWLIQSLAAKNDLDTLGSIDSRIPKIVTDAQTGADRAALDWALSRGIECGGWCPKGRKAEDGPIRKKYPLIETPSASYIQRTEWNVRDTEGRLYFQWTDAGRRNFKNGQVLRKA